jgi:hypothetical protein
MSQLDAARAEVARWTIATCAECGRPFPRSGVQRTCIGCYKDDKGYEILLGDKAFLRMQDELVRVQKELDAALVALTVERAKAKEAADALAGLRAHLKSLVLLCHPDRHKGSKVANEVTAWLLDLRGKV